MALIAAVCLFFARNNKSGQSKFNESPDLSSPRVIAVFDMDENHLQQTIDEFLNTYTDNNERPTVSHSGNISKLTFSPNMDYISLCYWVNFLVYSNQNAKNPYKVLGWYPFGQVQLNGKNLSFSNQTIMLYIDKDDHEYDNISFVTPDGKHYLQPFANTANLKPNPHGGEDYLPVIQ
ncbi:MAG: hypothetical protein J6T03_02435 [Bacteroidales bacterium]|nr:hypothetical protein [Bacteroidales bacterium]